jgi:hypothetical protein
VLHDGKLHDFKVFTAPKHTSTCLKKLATCSSCNLAIFLSAKNSYHHNQIKNIKSPDLGKKLGFPSVSLLLHLLLLFFFFFYQNCNFELHWLLNFCLCHSTHFNPNAGTKPRV